MEGATDTARHLTEDWPQKADLGAEWRRQGGATEPDGMEQTKTERDASAALGLALRAMKEHQYIDQKRQVVLRLIKRAERRVFLFDLLKKLRIRRPHLNLLSELRPLLSLEPSNEKLKAITKKYLSDLNRDTMARLRHETSRANEPILLVIGCRKYRRKLRTAVKHLRENYGGVVFGIMANKSMKDWKIRYDEAGWIITLPCKDGYEALTEKIVWACLAINMANRTASILKVDDDIKSVDKIKAKKLNEEVIANGNKAAGSPISVKSPLNVDRGWHLGKSKGKKNIEPFQGIGPKIWMSGGAGYLMTPDAAETVGEFGLHSWEFVKAQTYEDLTVSWIVESCSGNIQWLEDVGVAGIMNERTQDIMSGIRYHKTEEVRGERQ